MSAASEPRNDDVVIPPNSDADVCHNRVAVSGLLREFCDQSDALVDALDARMKVRSAANITTDELGDWIAKAEGCAQALRDVQLLRRLGAHV